MRSKRNILKNWKLWIGIIIALLLVIFVINYNDLSKYETMEKFLNLVSLSEYNQAKKYITKNFQWDLSSVKKKNLEYAESFTYKYGDYYLDDNYDIAYIHINLKETKAAKIIKFKLKQTMFGLKIDEYNIDWIEY